MSAENDETTMNERTIEYAEKMRKYRQLENDMRAYNDSLQN